MNIIFISLYGYINVRMLICFGSMYLMCCMLFLLPKQLHATDNLFALSFLPQVGFSECSELWDCLALSVAICVHEKRLSGNTQKLPLITCNTFGALSIKY